MMRKTLPTLTSLVLLHGAVGLPQQARIVFASSVTAHALRLEPGDDLRVSLIQYCAQANLSATTVLSCVGSLSEMRLRLAGADAFLDLEESLEIVSLVGTICADADHHLHCAVARADGSVLGGHIKGPAIVATTAEVVLGEMGDLDFSRELDDATGYQELQIGLHRLRGGAERLRWRPGARRSLPYDGPTVLSTSSERRVHTSTVH